jgi:YhcH/YjgK/YiaL family protein
MIFDQLEAASQYSRLHPGFDAAFDLLRSTPFDELDAGRHEVMGDSLFLIIDRNEGVGREKARLEGHRKYIDVQYMVPGDGRGTEDIGWRALSACREVAVPFDEAKDVLFYAERPEIWIPLHQGHFAVFFPGDIHAPLGGSGKVLKAVVKVAVDW